MFVVCILLKPRPRIEIVATPLKQPVPCAAIQSLVRVFEAPVAARVRLPQGSASLLSRLRRNRAGESKALYCKSELIAFRRTRMPAQQPTRRRRASFPHVLLLPREFYQQSQSLAISLHQIRITKFIDINHHLSAIFAFL